MRDVDFRNRFISQCRVTTQEKKCHWPLFVNCVEMMVARRPLVIVQSSLHLDFLEFIRSVVAGLLKNITQSAFSRPSERRIVNNSVDLHNSVNAKLVTLCILQNYAEKNVKNEVLACILWTFLTTTSERVLSFLGKFVVI